MTETHAAASSHKRISDDSLDQLFREARTHWVWRPEPVPIELLKQIYDVARFGPTSANSSPARFVFLTTPQSRERLRPALSPGNVEKTMTAPVTVIPKSGVKLVTLIQICPKNEHLLGDLCSS
jgi:3-hydroxypropanoate dehydrogenase